MDHIQKLRGPRGARNKARIGYMEKMCLDICICKKHSFWMEGQERVLNYTQQCSGLITLGSVLRVHSWWIICGAGEL